MNPVRLHPSFSSGKVHDVLAVIAASPGIAGFKTHLQFWMGSHTRPLCFSGKVV